MTNIWLFIGAALALLLSPGPTNTLLMYSGAAAGVRRSLSLVAAELCGYCGAIALLVLGLGPIVRAYPMFGASLRVAAAAYLVAMAVQLWTTRLPPGQRSEPLAWRKVFVATLFNPKAVLFAFVIIPHLFDGRLEAAVPYLLTLSALIVLAGAAWIVFGAMLGPVIERIAGRNAAHRLSAVAQLFFAAVLIVSVVSPHG
jgi:threonine/homoserine/homoserine lactone efflux protein